MKARNLKKMPSSSPLQEYLLSRDSPIGRLAATEMPSGGNLSVDDLDCFMEKVTEKCIFNEARNFMKGGSSKLH
jgi:hypothetical protein